LLKIFPPFRANFSNLGSDLSGMYSVEWTAPAARARLAHIGRGYPMGGYGVASIEASAGASGGACGELRNGMGKATPA
jgi:hypothetical protein